VDGLGCWHLTLSAVRPLKVLYFDGNSAAKLKEGTLDSQDIMVWGKISPERRVAERERLSGLCEWGKQFGIDGYLRYISANSSRLIAHLRNDRMEMAL
jgi:hypothetical protein